VLTIVWDVDDVLNDLMLVWFTEEWAPAHPGCRLSYADIRENPPHRVLGITKSEYLASMDSFRFSLKARSMKPNAAILKWLECYGARCRHVALTARPLDSIPHLAEWVFRHFGAYFRSFGAVPARQDPAAPRYDNDKSDFLKWFARADLFIDDSEDNVKAAQRLGMNGVVYPQPWNRSSSTVAETLKLVADLVEAN
jgi:hypothetical protein